MAPRKPKTDPEKLEMPAQKMAVVEGKGIPADVFAKLMPALYGAVYTLKYSLKKTGVATFKVGAPRARFPDIPEHLQKKDWRIIIGLPVPDDTTSLTQKVLGTEVGLETWQYGTVAQILHLGAYDAEELSIDKLRKFITENGYKIAGDHEEEYLSRPGAKVLKTIIRYPIRK